MFAKLKYLGVLAGDPDVGVLTSGYVKNTHNLPSRTSAVRYVTARLLMAVATDWIFPETATDNETSPDKLIVKVPVIVPVGASVP